eukprot:NODE_135_length_16508_cov_1.365897.p15 type:complete len:113 gc:universal NODE_135_length_16508_cov_1.365897:5414-5752(+)
MQDKYTIVIPIANANPTNKLAIPAAENGLSSELPDLVFPESGCIIHSHFAVEYAQIDNAKKAMVFIQKRIAAQRSCAFGFCCTLSTSWLLSCFSFTTCTIFNLVSKDLLSNK